MWSASGTRRHSRGSRSSPRQRDMWDSHMPLWRYGGLSRSTCFVVQETPWQGTASCSDQRPDLRMAISLSRCHPPRVVHTHNVTLSSSSMHIVQYRPVSGDVLRLMASRHKLCSLIRPQMAVSMHLRDEHGRLSTTSSSYDVTLPCHGCVHGTWTSIRYDTIRYEMSSLHRTADQWMARTEEPSKKISPIRDWRSTPTYCWLQRHVTQN